MSELREAIAAATSTLVCTPSDAADCAGLLSAAGPETTVLWVTYASATSACIRHYRADGGAGELSVIAVGEAGASAPSGVSVERVSAREDLTGLGILLSRKLTSHDDVVVCFDSLTALLRHVDHETAYEFLNAVTAHLYEADASAHFHLDPSAHDDEVVGALASLFDVIAEWRDRAWRVRTRKLFQN